MAGFVVLFFFTPPLSLLAQDSLAVSDSANVNALPRPVVIDNIVIRGNEVTKDYVILREMSLHPGDTLTLSAAEFDRDRISSLGLFNRVELSYHLTNDTATLYVDVHERWYIFPFLVIGVKDRDWKKFYYGLGFLHDNFRGRNEKVSASFALGYDPYVSLRYSNPLLGLGSNLFINTKLFYSRLRNKSLASQLSGPNFDEDHYGFEGAIGKRLNIFQSLSVSAGYEVITVSQNEAGRTLSPSGRDAFISAGVSFVHDTRDLAEYPSRGAYVGVSLSKYGFGESAVNYARLYTDSRKFFPVFGGVIIGGRLFTGLATGGTVPNYHHVFFGYQERIRGHFSDVYEGENIFGTSLEMRIPLISIRYFRVGPVPIPEFALWRFGMYATAFGDAGKVWYRSDPFTLRDLVKGYGAGLNFLLPYGTVVRVEYGMNELRRAQFIFDLSASF
jgi:outer membrane protein assembly factor BamA